MKKIWFSFAFAFLICNLSFAQISGNIESFKNSDFYKNYLADSKLNKWAMSKKDNIDHYDFWASNIISHVDISVDTKTNTIIKQTVFLGRFNAQDLKSKNYEVKKDERNKLSSSFILEATGGIFNQEQIASLLNEFDEGYRKVLSGKGTFKLFPEIPEGTKTKITEKFLIKISGGIIGDETITVEDIAFQQARDREKQEFKEALEKGDAESYIIKGQMAEMNRQMDNTHEAYIASFREAMPFYKKALELEPNNRSANLLLSNAYHGIGETQKAIELQKKYVEAYPEDIQAQYGLGTFYLDIKDYNNAIMKFNICVNLFKTQEIPEDLVMIYTEVYRNLADALKSLGKYTEAIEAYQNMLKETSQRNVPIVMNLSQLHNEIGELHLLLGNLDEALEQVRKLRSLDKRYAGDMWADKLEEKINNFKKEKIETGSSEE